MNRLTQKICGRAHIGRDPEGMPAGLPAGVCGDHRRITEGKKNKSNEVGRQGTLGVGGHRASSPGIFFVILGVVPRDVPRGGACG